MKTLLALLVLAFALPAGAAADPSLPPSEGTAAPDFKLQDQHGAWHTKGQYAGKWLVLYFYPKDGTPGCTKQVCAFRDEITKVRAAGAEVVGVSVDAVASHEKFAKEHNVPFPLLADADKTAAKAYGVLTSKLGFEYARRDTFVIDPQGKIAKHYPDVDPEQNVTQVLNDLASLKAAAAEPSAELQRRMTGHFRVAESESVLQQRLAAAIDHAVEPMNFVARPIARSRLKSVVYYCQGYEMALGPEAVRVACDDRPRIERRLDNSEGPVAGLQAEPVDVKVQVGGDTVELRIAGKDGTRITTYRFDDRGALEVDVKVVSPRLERPVTWKVLYRRTGAGDRRG